MPDADRDRFDERYRTLDGVMVAIEVEVLGSDYGANGYTSRAQADEIGELLDLGANSTLLDLGSGCGWPGLYLAARSGCRVVTVDPAEAGVGRSATRSAADGLVGRHLAVRGDGQRLPFASASVDAVVHVDVLC